MGHAEQFPFKSGFPLGVTVISNSGFFVVGIAFFVERV
jgi:hypothetical protein